MTIRTFIAYLLVLATLNANAAPAEVPVLSYAGTGGTVAGGKILNQSPSEFTRLITRNPGAGVKVADSLIAKANGLTDFQLLLSRNVSKATIAAAAPLALKTLPFIGTGVALWEIFDVMRVRPDGAGSVNLDPGVSPVSQNTTLWKCNGQGSFVHSSAVAACTALIAPLTTTYNAQCNDGSSVSMTSTKVLTLQSSTATTAVVAVTNNVTRGTTTGTNCTNQASGSFVQTPFNAQGNVTVVTECPASVDAVNPANSIPAGQAVGPDGLCRTGRYTTPLSIVAAGQRWTTFAPDAAVEPTARGTLDRGIELAPDAGGGTLSGPASVALPGKTTTTTGPSGTITTTETPTSTITYNGPSYTTTVTTIIVTNNGGAVTTTTGSAPPEIKVCGLPGTPPCKIDETGTPGAILPYDTSSVDATKNTDATKQNTEIERVINPGFGWFAVPPMATCAPIAWPGGVQINPCNGIEVVRSIMAYLWALYGAVWSFGVFRRSLPGAA